MRPGYETGQFGKRLAARIQLNSAYSDWHVYYDHGDPELDAGVAATKGFFKTEDGNLSWLADIDILVASLDGLVQFLIEIEERSCSPKKILGDTLAILLSNRFAVHIHGEERMIFKVSPFTCFIVAGIVPNRGDRLRKIKEVIGPQVHRLEGLTDGVSPKNVHYVFNEMIAETFEELESIVATKLADRVV
jgi:hypothetical protein